MSNFYSTPIIIICLRWLGIEQFHPEDGTELIGYDLINGEISSFDSTLKRVVFQNLRVIFLTKTKSIVTWPSFKKSRVVLDYVFGRTDS